MINNEIIDENLLTEEIVKKIKDESNKRNEIVKKMINDLTIKTEKNDGTTEIRWFMNSEHLICEQKDAIYQVVKTIEKDGSSSSEVKKIKDYLEDTVEFPKLSS